MKTKNSKLYKKAMMQLNKINIKDIKRTENIKNEENTLDKQKNV